MIKHTFYPLCFDSCCRIDFYKTGAKESIFKIEEKQKRELLERVASITVTEESPDSGTDSPDSP